MLDLGFIHALKRIVKLVPKKRQTLFFSATMPQGDQAARRRLSDQPGRSVGDPGRDHGRAGRAERDHRQPGREVGAADPLPADATRSSARWSSAAPSMAPTRSSASSSRPASAPPRSTATSPSRSANARSPRSSRARCRCWSRPTSPRAGSTSRASATSSTSTCPTFPSNMSTASAAPRAPAPTGIAIAFCSPDERINLRDIERTTRQKLPVAGAARRLQRRGAGAEVAQARSLGARRAWPAAVAAMPAMAAHRRPSGPRVAIQPTGDRREGAAASAA